MIWQFSKKSIQTNFYSLLTVFLDALNMEYFTLLGKALGDDWRLLVDRLGISQPRVQSILQKNKSNPDRDNVIKDVMIQWFKATKRAADKVKIYGL